MGKVKQLTLDRYEHGLMVRARYDLGKRMITENAPTEDIEDLLLKVIDAPSKKKWRILRFAVKVLSHNCVQICSNRRELLIQVKRPNTYLVAAHLIGVVRLDKLICPCI